MTTWHLHALIIINTIDGFTNYSPMLRGGTLRLPFDFLSVMWLWIPGSPFFFCVCIYWYSLYRAWKTGGLGTRLLITQEAHTHMHAHTCTHMHTHAHTNTHTHTHTHTSWSIHDVIIPSEAKFPLGSIWIRVASQIFLNVAPTGRYFDLLSSSLDYQPASKCTKPCNASASLSRFTPIGKLCAFV